MVTYLIVLYDGRVVAVLARDDVLQVKAHLLQLVGKCSQTVDLLADQLVQMSLGRVLDVSHQMLDTDLFLW